MERVFAVMKMKVSGLEGVELEGKIARVYESSGSLVVDIRLNKPAGWQAKATLTHGDLMSFARLLLKPATIRYLIFGFGKPRAPKERPAVTL